jgi:DNA-binding transcriptional ArsR family regulator
MTDLGEAPPNLDQESSLDIRLGKAMSHPVRIEILDRLRLQPASPVDLHGKLDLPLSNVSYHFKVLKELGCIRSTGQEQIRGALKTTYKSVFDMLLDTPTWAKLSPATKARITRAGLHSIVQRADEAIEAKTLDTRSDRHLAVMTLMVDEEGWSEMAGLLDQVLQRFYAISDESSARVGDSDNRFPVTMSNLLFESPVGPGGQMAT